MILERHLPYAYIVVYDDKYKYNVSNTTLWRI
jgi:hypothetical protein